MSYQGSGVRQPAPRRYRRSSFNGARQLDAYTAPARRVLVLLGLLALCLLTALGLIAWLCSR